MTFKELYASRSKMNKAERREVRRKLYLVRDIAGVSKSTIIYWGKHSSIIPLMYRKLIAEIFKVPFLEFFPDEADMNRLTKSIDALCTLKNYERTELEKMKQLSLINELEKL